MLILIRFNGTLSISLRHKTGYFVFNMKANTATVNLGFWTTVISGRLPTFFNINLKFWELKKNILLEDKNQMIRNKTKQNQLALCVSAKPRKNKNTGTPHFIVLCFIELHRYCFSLQIEGWQQPCVKQVC